MNEAVYTAALRVAKDAVMRVLKERLYKMEAEEFVNLWEMTRVNLSNLEKVYPMSCIEDWVRESYTDPVALMRQLLDEDTGFCFDDDYICPNGSGRWFTTSSEIAKLYNEALAEAIWNGFVSDKGEPWYWQDMSMRGLNPADILKELAK